MKKIALQSVLLMVQHFINQIIFLAEAVRVLQY